MVTLGLLTTKNYAMKKFLIALALTIGSTNFGNAQIDKTDNPTEEAQEKLQQEPPRQTQARLENSAKQSATQYKRNEEQAEKDRKKQAAEKSRKEKESQRKK